MIYPERRRGMDAATGQVAGRSAEPEPGLQLRPVSWVVISYEPSAAMWNTLFYTNTTPQTGR